MSKKKTKTRIEKAVTHHDFSHLTATKTSAYIVSSEGASASPEKASHLSPLDSLISKDLKTGAILVASIIGVVVILGLIVYQSHLLTPLFKHFGLSY